MQRGTLLAFVLLFAAAVVVVVLQARMPAIRNEPVRPSAEASSRPSTPVPEGGSAAASTEADPGADAASSETDADFADLPPGAPKTVGFGVILVTYSGVQFAPDKARTKQQARDLARELLEVAKKDFSEAVKKGDRGSTADAGHIPRGVLEPPVERALFSLEKGAVHDEPLETPRGYWIVRRND